MSKLIKVSLLVISGAVGLSFLIVIGLLVFVDANRFKPRVEAAASDLLEMEVMVDGKMGVSIFPSLHVTLHDVHLRNGGMELAEATQLTLWVELRPLLSREVRVNKIVATKPTITITKDKQGAFNLERATPSQGGWPTVTLPRVSLMDATLVYVDKQSGRDFQVNDCRLHISDLRFANNLGFTNNKTDPSNDLTFSSELDCGEVRADGFRANNLTVVAEQDGTELNLSPISFQLFGAQGSGSIRAEFAARAIQYQVQFSLPQFPIEAFFSTLAEEQSTDQIAHGTMDFSANLSMQGKTINEIIQTAKGHLSLRGENLILNGSDLDHQFEEFESSQHFNLVDIGAFFYAGPLGLVLTKGYDFSSILRGTGGHSEITALVSEWQVDKGVAKAVDVAMATPKNRIAMQGRLDFVNGRYDDITVALIDVDGCAKVQQKIHGTFREPVVEQPNILKSLAGPVINLLEKGRDLFPGGECDVFYNGSVASSK